MSLCVITQIVDLPCTFLAVSPLYLWASSQLLSGPLELRRSRLQVEIRYMYTLFLDDLCPHATSRANLSSHAHKLLFRLHSCACVHEYIITFLILYGLPVGSYHFTTSCQLASLRTSCLLASLRTSFSSIFQSQLAQCYVTVGGSILSLAVYISLV